MFGRDNWIALGATVEKEYKGPPPPATPLDFPQYVPANHNCPFTEGTAKDWYGHFATIQKPADVTGKHVDDLNLRVLRDQSLDDIVPSHPSDTATFLPDLRWDVISDNIDDPTANSIVKQFLCNGREAPRPDVYRSRKAELAVDNEDAFRAVQRLAPQAGKQPMRPGYFYKFWQNLFLMSQYWDTSLDHEYEERQGSFNDAGGTNEPSQPSRRYTGRRTGTGRDMPDSFRDDTVKALVDTVTWLFGCQLSPPRMPPRLRMQSSFFSVRLSYSVFRTLLDRQQIRQGLVEGPVMGVQTRPETSFRLPEEPVGTGKGEALDLLRELGALLLLAQERAREGKSQKKPGEGKWYTSIPRWGGGPGGEVGNVTGNGDEEIPKKEERKSGTKTRRRKNNAVEAYKKLHPGMGTWDSRVTYLAIGKDDESEVDDFASQLPWYMLELRRSKWYDLFSAEDRVKAMRGIWGVTAWLMRDKSKTETAGSAFGEDVVMSD
ncbi:MAG: hypothetical protein M1816_004614 [Peltula sp. TS41687]|nr:MAG: hypothetical protein M1816_004614 [Peltula sp. TS41687]